MAESLAKRWRQFWQTIVVTMDADPHEDVHSRLRRLEETVFHAPAPRDPVVRGPSVSATE
jgi:hypothetical protein